MKILTVVGTRPELIKLSRVIAVLDGHMDHVLAHTGQNYDFELNQIFFRDLDIRQPDHFLEISTSKSAGAAIASVIEKTDRLLEGVRPDGVLYYGDTNSCLGVIAAKRRRIPVFHMEAGNRCFDQRVPEEINRKVVDHLSDVNFVHSEHARRYLLREGLAPERVFKTGSPMGEVLAFYKGKFENSRVLEDLKLEKNRYFLASVHREENVDREENLRALLSAFDDIVKKHRCPLVVSAHPRTRARMAGLRLAGEALVRFVKPLGFSDYVVLQKNAKCVLSDSGTVTEEASYLGFPAVNLRETHERPEGMDQATVILTGLDRGSISACLEMAVAFGRNSAPLIEDYSEKKVSRQVVKIVRSYVHYINRVVWGQTGR